MAQRFPNTSNNQPPPRFSGPPLRQYGGPNYSVSSSHTDQENLANWILRSIPNGEKRNQRTVQ